VNLSSKLNWN